MMKNKYSVIIMMIALFGGQTALAQEKIVPETPPVPQDRLDTLYYNKSWKVTPNKAFANYYRLALYPADSTAAKEFRTYYMSGELQGEGSFVVLDKKDDAKSQFAGTFTTYFKDGQVEQKKTYLAGLLSGEYTSYYNNGNVKEHFFMNQGKKMGVGASFTENGRVCTLTPYKNDVPEGFYVVVDADGNYSKYSLTDHQPILETPSPDEILTEYKNGVAWPYYNKNGLIVGVSNSMVDENIGDYREIGVFIVNKSMINVDIDPSQIEIYDMKGGKRKDFELVGADEYDKKIFKFKKKVAKRAVKNKAIVQTERENNVNANLGAQVFDAGTSNTYKNDIPEGFYVVVDADGNYSKYSLTDHQPIQETPSPDEILTEYKNGVAWPYYNKNGLIVGVSNSMVDENIGDYREIGVFIVNKSMINVDIDPSQIEIYDMKGGKRKDFELVGADEYDKKIFKFKKKVAKRAVKNKAIVQTERENNVNANLGAQVFDAGTSNTLKDFQTRICRMQQLEDGNRMKYSDKMPEDLGYLERTTIHPGEVVSGYLYTTDRKAADLFVKVKIKGIDYLFEWKASKKK